VVTDKIGSPTFTEDLARGIIELVSLERYGLYHMANQGSCSRYEIAKRMVEIMNRADVVIKPITSDKFPLPAPRGDSEAIENFKLNLLGLCQMRSCQEALKEYVEVLMQQEK
jgi:dTDP-4-dehydrorhamnose reductase